MAAIDNANLPHPRGPLSARLSSLLCSPVRDAPEVPLLARQAVAAVEDSMSDEDVQLSLAMLYELHYRSWREVDDGWEWHPDLIAAGRELELVLERDLRRFAAEHSQRGDDPAEVPAALIELVSREIGPSLSRYLGRKATVEQYREFLIHRSIYHLKEADPHTWAIPRLAGDPKAALVEVQSDEYGGGRAEWMHAALFATTMRGVDLTDTYGAYVDAVPAVTLAWANTMTMFGLHRRFRGAAVGHLAALEMTSSLPNKRYGNGLRRLGFDAETTRFFDEHVEADAVHEQIACHDLAGGLATQEPSLVSDILFGAAAAMVADARVTTHLLGAWDAGVSSLRPAPARQSGDTASGADAAAARLLSV